MPQYFHPAGRPDLVITLSDNDKTGYSINVSRLECDGATTLCYWRCYSKKRDDASPPMDWEPCREVYFRNSWNLRALLKVPQGIVSVAARIESFLCHKNIDNLRICGSGDLFPELAELVLRLALFGIRCWGFSKCPDMLHYLAGRYEQMVAGLPPAGEMGSLYSPVRPYFLGSIDESSTPNEQGALCDATRRLNGEPTLACMVMDPGWVGQLFVREHYFRDYIKVVFGYHAGAKKTILQLARECPATAGRGVHCQECRRCMGWS